MSQYSPIFTTADGVFVAAPVTRATVQQSRAALLDASWATVTDVQLGTATHDSDPGHRSATVAVAGGVVHAAAAGHHAAWRDLSGESLGALSATSNPTGSANTSYYRYFVNGSDIYLVVRYGASPRPTRIYKWVASAWSLIGGGDFAGQGGYGGDLAFASDGTIYATVGFTPNADTGFPRRQGSIVKSTNGGTDWTDLAGVAVTLPMTYANAGTRIFWPGTFNLIGLAVDGDDNPVAVASYKPDNATYRELWQATWDGTRIVHSRIQTHPTGAPIGDVAVTSHAGTIVMTVGEYDTHDDPDFPTGPFTAGKLWLLTSDGGGTSWTRYELHDGTGGSFYSGAYLDPTSLAVDGVVRMLPMDLGAPSNHEVWELTLP